MPIYEYECQQCRDVHEAFQNFSDDPLTVCPQCGGPLKKLMSLNSFHLKGSGWYVTDYGKSGGGDGSRPSQNDSAPKADKADKADKKAAKSDAKSE